MQGKLILPLHEEEKTLQEMAFSRTRLEDAWEIVTIKVYKDHFVGYYRWKDPRPDHLGTSLFTLSGTYEKGYLVGTWDLSTIYEWTDTNHGPYPQVYEGEGTFISGLVEYNKPINANIKGSITYSHGDFGPETTPENPVWIKETISESVSMKWEGATICETCGGPELDEYVGKKLEAAIVTMDWSNRAKVLHCGLSDGNNPVEWQPVKEGEIIYISDKLLIDPTSSRSVIVQEVDYTKKGTESYYGGRVWTMGGEEWFKDNPGATTLVFYHHGPEETKLGLVIGRLWLHTTMMLEGQNPMTLYNSQAVAGIKGTNFILFDNGLGTTTLEVLEGEVEFTATADNTTIKVGPGQKIEATYEGLGQITTFDPAPQLEKFAQMVNNTTPVDPEEEIEDFTAGPPPEGSPDAEPSSVSNTSGNGLDIILIGLIVVVAVDLILYKRKKDK
jgi:hypothetical protein